MIQAVSVTAEAGVQALILHRNEMEERGALSHTTALQAVTQNIPQYHYLLGIVKPQVFH